MEDESRDWVEAKHGRLAKDWWPVIHLLPPFPSTISLISSTNTFETKLGALATWASHPATILGQLATPWLPYKRVGKGSLLLHPKSSQEP
jgi:hypothetical protein